MWQKCWNTNQSLVHNLRFRERGPLKSWRPETMAEAIMSVLKEGLSLSQAARKYDIPYPTFVLYANRVHNMLGPSADGGTGENFCKSNFILIYKLPSILCLLNFEYYDFYLLKKQFCYG